LLSQKPKQGYKLVKSLFGKYDEIPENWEMCHLTDQGAITLYSGEGIKKNQEDGQYPIYGSNGIIGFTEKYNETDCILIGRVGSSGSIHLLDQKAWITDNVLISKTGDRLEKKFAFYALIFLNLPRFATKSAQPLLTQSILKVIKIKIPPIVEQRKIVEILSNVDNLISSYDKTIQITTRLKKGLIPQLLTKGIGHKKFKKVKGYHGKEIEVPEEWEMTTIGKEFDISAGGTPKTNNPEFFNGNIHWVTSSDLTRGIIHTSTARITPNAVKKTNLKIFPKDSLIIAAIGVDAVQTRGNCGILAFDATINQVCVGFKKSRRVMTKYFFYFYLHFANNLIFTFSQGTKQWAFYPYIIRKISFSLPPKKEQEKIVEILNNVDSKISELKSKKSNLEHIKKGLMQKLLSGQILVKI